MLITFTITTYMNKNMKTLGEGGGGVCLNSTLQLHVSLLINFITLIKGHFIDRCKKNGQNECKCVIASALKRTLHEHD